jgi:O-antigen ligase
MSASGISLASPRGTARYGTPNLIFWVIAIGLLPAAAVLGGMKFLVLGLAVGAAVAVWTRPSEAPAAAMLFLLAASVLLPSSARLDYSAEPWEMYYWAAGLLVITLAATARLGPRRLLSIPTSAKVFAAVTLAAAVQGLIQGAAPSDVLKGLYGALLLVAYLAIALHVGSEALLVRRIRTLGTACAACFLIYYAAVFGEYGFHKEITGAAAEAALLAAILYMHGAEQGRRSWILRAILLLLVAALVFARGSVLLFLFAVTLGLAMKLQSKKLRRLTYVAAVLIALPVIFPPVTQIVARQLRNAPVIGAILPTGARNASSLEDRAAELPLAAATLQTHPLLGVGLGAHTYWKLPTVGLLEQQYVDDGWAYLLFKMGLIGLAAFLWLLVTILGGISRRSVALSACLVSAVVIAMPVQPIFLNFQTAPFVGSLAGLLLARKYRDARTRPAAPRG